MLFLTEEGAHRNGWITTCLQARLDPDPLSYCALDNDLVADFEGLRGNLEHLAHNLGRGSVVPSFEPINHCLGLLLFG